MRVEFKYLVSSSVAEELRILLDRVGTRDKHSSDFGYLVSSLYFDSSGLDAFYEKEEGVFSREKFRVRFLDGLVVLEKKCKAGLLGWKDRFYRGSSLNRVGLEFKESLLSHEIFPVIFIKYNRLAFDVGDCRVTIDSNISGESNGFVKEVCPGMCVVEVKFINGKIPSVIYDAICKFNLKRVAFSKYYEGVVAIYGRNPKSVVPEQFCINTLY